ncbi:hypothetical protein VTN00DRAFT_2845 [Thermoascus crustaceus]|uniref:uncharacterized protein n=1 Tax=Thermoascus crustaceus TaxID=5088 RepID=UPI0037442911
MFSRITMSWRALPSFALVSRNHRLARYPSSGRAFATTPARRNSSEDSNSVKEGLAAFKAFGRPFAKVFLGAIFTYQVIYWTWLKLEMDEAKLEKNKEIAALEKKARDLASAQK